jgi:hypothetical protein
VKRSITPLPHFSITPLDLVELAGETPALPGYLLFFVISRNWDGDRFVADRNARVSAL